MVKEFAFLFVLFMLLFLLKVTFFWDNFATYFFQSNDKWEYTFNANNFVLDFTFYNFFTQSYCFFLQQHRHTFLQIPTTNYFPLS